MQVLNISYIKTPSQVNALSNKFIKQSTPKRKPNLSMIWVKEGVEKHQNLVAKWVEL
ncbi:MAG: hypothetical protein AAF378_04915 [Cyanobacteria bacterium P01_A01_bin.84]